MKASKSRFNPEAHARAWPMRWERWNKQREIKRSRDLFSQIGELVEEHGLYILAEQIDSADDDDRKRARDHRIFDGGGAAFIAPE